jgi:phospholipase C
MSRNPASILALLSLATLNAAPRHAIAQSAIPIQHVIIIMQENRSFDSYFGTYPGANGIPAGVCVPLNREQPAAGCVAPFHDPHEFNAGGTHGAFAAQYDLDNGIQYAKMDGFVAAQTIGITGNDCVQNPDLPQCAGIGRGALSHDAMGYHDYHEISSYWTYASNFVLQDELFSSSRSWSLPAHLYLSSGWSAMCGNQYSTMTCEAASNLPQPTATTVFPWVSYFELLDANGISWKYYLGQGTEPDCVDGNMICPPVAQNSGVPSIWNPAPSFTYVQARGPSYLAAHVPNANQFLADIQAGTLPQVSWIIPSGEYSEHPPAGITMGMEYVTSLVNAVMQSPYWQNTAIFITWDDWGGFYDHVPPPNVDENTSSTPIQGFGLRVPGLMISAWAKRGFVDHAILSHDSYMTLIEDLFMRGQRLNPATLGNPDTRGPGRDSLTQVSRLWGAVAPMGNLLDEFDFSLPSPRGNLVLKTTIPSNITASCNANAQMLCQSETVTITWNPVPPQPGNPTYTYGVRRDDQLLRQCSGTALSCTDTPGSGPHLYRAFSIAPDGAASPASAAAEADEP